MPVAFLRSATNDATSGSLTLTITVTINANDNVAVFFTVGGATVTITSVKDNNGNDYGGALATGGDNVNTSKVWAYGKIGAPAATSVTITFANSPTISNGVVLVYSGATNFGNTGSFSNTGTTNPTISVTTQDNNNVIASCFAQLSSLVATAQNGTIRVNNANSNQASRFVTAVDNTAASPSSVTDSYTIGASANVGGVAVELRAVAVSGGTYVVYLRAP